VPGVQRSEVVRLSLPFPPSSCTSIETGISIDTKDKVKAGELSRGGQSRGTEAVKANDHDMEYEEKMVPLGILDVLGNLLTMIFGTSAPLLT